MNAYQALTGELVARTALHIGSGQESGATDALCRRDAQGRYLIPGTALKDILLLPA